LFSFLVSFLVLYFLLIYFDIYSIFQTFFSTAIYNHFSMNYENIVLSGNSIDFGRFVINIQDVCSGAYELIVFISLIFACFEIKWGHRIAGAITYFILFLIFNYVRMLTIIYAFAFLDFTSLELMHTILFKFGFLIFTLLFFIYFLIFSSKN